MKHIDEKQLLLAVGEVGDDLIARAEQPVRRRTAPYLRWGALAACFCLIAVLAVLPQRMGMSGNNYTSPPKNSEGYGDVLIEGNGSPMQGGEPGIFESKEDPADGAAGSITPESAPEDDGKELPALIDPAETSLQVTHIRGGQWEETAAAGEELDALRVWADGLLPGLEARSFVKGESPGDSDGGEVYSFTGGTTDFSYIINGPADCWVLTGSGQWYAVAEPADPPVEF